MSTWYWLVRSSLLIPLHRSRMHGGSCCGQDALCRLRIRRSALDSYSRRQRTSRALSVMIVTHIAKIHSSESVQPMGPELQAERMKAEPKTKLWQGGRAPPTRKNLHPESIWVVVARTTLRG